MVGKQEYHVALFRLCSNEDSFFETFVWAGDPEEAMKEGVDLAIEEEKIPQDILEEERPIFVCVSNDEEEYHYVVFPYEGGYEWKEYEPIFDLQECKEVEEEEE